MWYVSIHLCCIQKCLRMRKSIYNMGNFTCHRLNFTNVVCGSWYVLYSILHALYPKLFMIYTFCYLACLIHLCCVWKSMCLLIFIYNMEKNTTLCVNFVASSLLRCIGKIMHSCSKLPAWVDSPFYLRWLLVLSRHDFSLWSNLHKLPFMELNNSCNYFCTVNRHNGPVLACHIPKNLNGAPGYKQNE